MIDAKKLLSVTIVAAFLISSLAAVVCASDLTADQRTTDIDNYIRGIENDETTDVAAHTGTTQLPCESTCSDSKTVTVQYTLRTADNDGTKVLCNSASTESKAYPGALLKGDKYLADNSPNAVLCPDRADLKFNIDLPISNQSFTVAPTDMSAVNEQIYAKCQEWATSGKSVAAQSTYEQVESSSSNQMKVDLNLTAEALQGLGLSLTWESTGTTNTCTVKYTQIFYTVSVSQLKANPSDYFGPTTTKADLESQIFDHSQAVIVRSVSYGRTVIATVTSEESTSDINAAISAAISGTEESLTYEQKEVLSNSSVSVYIYGGEIPEKMPTTIDGVIEYIENSSITADNITTAKPIQYTTSWIDSGNDATTQNSCEYNEKTVTETVAIDFSFRFNGAYEGQCWITYTTYDSIDADGNKVGEKEVTDKYGVYCADHSYSYTITAKHGTDFYLTVHAYGNDDAITNYLCQPLESIWFYHGGTICDQSFCLKVDGVVKKSFNY